MAPRLSKEWYFLGLVKAVASRSTCARRSVGAIIVDGYSHILSTGYNGVPSDFPHCIDTPCAGAGDKHNDLKRCMAIHAEMNAVLQCSNIAMACRMYTSCTPCFDCAKVIANTPIKHIVTLETYSQEGLDVLRYRGIKVSVPHTTLPNSEFVTLW